MTSEPTSRHPNADDGSWESLAENLFGIDFKQPAPGEDLAAEDLSLDDELLGPPAARAETGMADSGVEAETPARSSAEALPRGTEEPAGRDFEEDLSFEEDLGFEEDLTFDGDPGFAQPEARAEGDDEEDVRLIEGGAAQTSPGTAAQARFGDDGDDELDDAFDVGFDSVEEVEEAEEVEDTEAVPAAEDDTYWDALKDWEWDDAEEPAAPAAGPQRRAGRAAATPRYVPRAVVEPEEPAWAEGRDEFIEDPDFAAGLLEEVPPASPALPTQSPAAAAAEPAPRRESRPAPPPRREPREEESGDEGPRRRRRRRRGRPEPAEPTTSQDEREEPERMDDTDVDQDFEPPAGLDESEGDEFGLGLEVQEAPPARDMERGPRRGRRRRSRRREGVPEEAERGSERSEPAATEPAWEDAAEPEREDVDESAPAARWEDIPTWEEAVALLVNPGRSGPREPSHSDGQRGSRPSRPRGDGGRRGRRRSR